MKLVRLFRSFFVWVFCISREKYWTYLVLLIQIELKSLSILSKRWKNIWRYQMILYWLIEDAYKTESTRISEINLPTNVWVFFEKNFFFFHLSNLKTRTSLYTFKWTEHQCTQVMSQMCKTKLDKSRIIMTCRKFYNYSGINVTPQIPCFLEGSSLQRQPAIVDC